MSILERLFTNGNNAAASATPPANTPAAPASGDPAATPDGKMPGTNQLPENPLDVYRAVLDNAAKNSDVQAPSFKLDPKVVSDVSSKLDFTSGVDQAVMQKALTGDAQALIQVIQQSNQAAYRTALEHGSSLTDTFIQHRSDFERKQIDTGVKSHLTQQNLATLPNYSHPVVKEELNRIASQFARANPDQSPQEIAQAAQKYLQDVAAALVPQSSKPADTKEMDWTQYLKTN